MGVLTCRYLRLHRSGSFRGLLRLATLLPMLLALAVAGSAPPIAGYAAPELTAGQQARTVRSPAILAKSAFLLDAESGGGLFQKFPDERRPMASTTKVMTGLLAAESGRLDEMATVSRSAAMIGETTMGLVESERIPLREALFGLMMNSGNDAAVVIAEHLAGTVPAFTAQMNARADRLGLRNTRFANPHGLDHGSFSSPNHYASARDLATLGAAAFGNSALSRAAGTLLREVPHGLGREPHRLRHTVSPLWWYPGALAGKTGWTGKAGQVRVVLAERGGARMVAVVMDSPDHIGEVRDLFDYGFSLSAKSDARQTIPLGPEGLSAPEPRLSQAWAAYKRLALNADGRIRRGADGEDASSDAQAASLLHAVWMRDRAAFDAMWGWTQLALSRRPAHSANPARVALFASRWSKGNVADWSNSTAADQRIAAALLQASRLWNEPALAAEADRILDAIVDKAALSWDVAGVPRAGWSIAAANSFLKELEPATTSGATLTPAFYRMFAEASRDVAWLWALDGTYLALERATASAPSEALGASVGLLPGWFSVSRAHGQIGQPVDPTWQTTGFAPESAALAWQLALDAQWNADERAHAMLAPTARLLARDLAQRGRISASYSRAGAPAAAETGQYGALAGIAQVEGSAEPAIRAKLEAALASNNADRLLDAMDGLWLLAGGPPNFWRIWNPPVDLPTTRNDGVIPPGESYPWRYFPETGHTVHGEMLEYLNAGGGVALFGLPRTEEFIEDGRLVQYFQRGRVEAPLDRRSFALAPLGRDAAGRRGALTRAEARPVAPFESDEARLYVPEAGHSVGAGFKAFYEKHGGATVLGYPLTEELQEDGFTVQYLERVVLEYLPGKPVQASLLGDDLLREKGWLK